MPITRGMMSSTTDMWGTPQAFFERMDEEYHFQTDVCAIKENAKCPHFYSPEDDGLKKTWTGVCWMNPPYGRQIGKWVKKAYESGREGATVVCLLPARTDTRWFQDYCLQSSDIRFVRGRLHFNEAKEGAPFPSCIVTFSPDTLKKREAYQSIPATLSHPTERRAKTMNASIRYYTADGSETEWLREPRKASDKTDLIRQAAQTELPPIAAYAQVLVEDKPILTIETDLVRDLEDGKVYQKDQFPVPETLYDLTQDEIQERNRAYALGCIPLDQPTDVALRYLDDRDGTMMACLKKAIWEKAPDILDDLVPEKGASFQKLMKDLENVPAKELLYAYHSKPEATQKAIREQYLENFWEVSRGGNDFEKELFNIEAKKQAACDRALREAGVPDERFFVLRPDWSSGVLMSRKDFFKQVLLDTSSCEQYQRLSYNPEEKCLKYSARRQNPAGYPETYEADIVPETWKHRFPDSYDYLQGIRYHAEEMCDIPGFPDLDSSVRDWYTRRYPTDELGPDISDASFRDVLDALPKGPDTVYKMLADDSLVRERVFSELSMRTGAPYEAIYESWLNECRLGAPIDGKEPDYWTIEECSEAVRMDTSMREWYQSVSRNPLAGIGMKEETFQEFVDHFHEHPDERFFQQDGRAFNAVLRMTSHLTGVEEADLRRGWWNHLPVSACHDLDARDARISDEQAAVLNDAFGKCGLHGWKAERDKEYNGVSITNDKGLWLGNQFSRDDLFEYLSKDWELRKDPQMQDVLTVIDAAIRYQNGDKDAYQSVLRENQEKDLSDEQAAILNDAFGKCHLDQWKAERDKEYNGVSITNGKGLWLGDQFPRRDLFEYLTTDPYFTKNEDLAEVVSVIRAAREYRSGDKDAYAKLNHRKAKTLNHYPKMRRYDAWR